MQKDTTNLCLYGRARHHHNSYKIRGIYYVRSWMTSVKNTIEEFGLSNSVIFYEGSSIGFFGVRVSKWCSPPNGPPLN